MLELINQNTCHGQPWPITLHEAGQPSTQCICSVRRALGTQRFCTQRCRSRGPLIRRHGSHHKARHAPPPHMSPTHAAAPPGKGVAVQRTITSPLFGYSSQRVRHLRDTIQIPATRHPASPAASRRHLHHRLTPRALHRSHPFLMTFVIASQ